MFIKLKNNINRIIALACTVPYINSAERTEATQGAFPTINLKRLTFIKKAKTM